jgi:arylsulfatase A-like enzyme
MRATSRAALAGLLLAPILLVALFGSSSPAAPPPKPNVVVIMSDDQRLSDLAFMPNTLSLLGDRGAVFDNAYVSYSLCCPSRATYLTGQYAHNHGVLTNELSTGGYPRLDGNHTLPLWMRAAGYRTGHVGKYLNGYGAGNPTEIPPGWDEWYGSPSSTHFRMYEYDLNCQATPAPPPDCGGLPHTDHPTKLRHYGVAPEDYKADVETELAKDFIARNGATPGHDPFFLSLAPIAPHVVHPGDRDETTGVRDMPQPAPRHDGQFRSLPLPKPPSFNERDIDDKPRYMRSRSRFKSSQVRLIRETYRRRLESLLAVDEMVKEVVEALEASGELDNTFIVFTSDNGYMLGEHRRLAGKVVPYEESIRVPLIVRGPGVPQGVHRPQLVSNVDLAPTIAAVGGASPDIVTDGISLLPVLEANAPLSRALLFETFSNSRNYRGVRIGHWAYFRYVTTREVEFYDLRRDPYELENLASQKRVPRSKRRLMRRLSRLLGRLKGCDGVGCNQPAPKRLRR